MQLRYLKSGLQIFITMTCVAASCLAQTETYKPSRTSSGHPDLNGIWQALGASHWNIEDHAAYEAAIVESGAQGAAPAGIGVLKGGEIPYQSWARKKRDENFRDRVNLDPAVKCYLPGLPRATYQPYPFQIVQSRDHILMAYEFAGANRTIYMNQDDLVAPVNSWMGHSLGHWEGDTLVVKVTDQVAETWLDRAGNFHSEQLSVEERYTPVSPFHLRYEVTITDPAVYTRPWRMSLPLYRRVDQNIQLLEFKCIEFVEELMYGHLSRNESPMDEKE